MHRNSCWTSPKLTYHLHALFKNHSVPPQFEHVCKAALCYFSLLRYLKKKIDSSFSTRFPRVTFQLSSLPRPPPSIQLPIFCFSSTPTLLWDACPTGKYGCLPYRQTAAGAERRCTVTHWRHMRVLRTSPPPLLLDVRSVLWSSTS